MIGKPSVRKRKEKRREGKKKGSDNDLVTKRGIEKFKIKIQVENRSIQEAE